MVFRGTGHWGRTTHVVCVTLLLSACGGGGAGSGDKSGEGGAAFGSMTQAPVAGNPSVPTSLPMGMGGKGMALLSWTPPTANTDESMLLDLAGYRVVYGSTPAELDQTVELKNPGLTSFVAENLPAGTLYFAIMSVNSAGIASAPSDIAMKVVD